MAGLKVYYDLMSQVSRAVVLFLKVTEIPYIPKPVALRKNEHLTEEYGRINPLHLVPAIDDDGFLLTESVAIMRYLCAKHKPTDHWYPQDLHRRAKVDEYIAWQHLNTRMAAATVFRTEVIEPRAKNIPVDKEKLRKFQAHLEITLDNIERVFLKDQSYLCGEDITIADILAVSELVQPSVAGHDVFGNRPSLAAWQKRVEARLQPHYDEVFSVLYKVRSTYLQQHPEKAKV